MSQSRKSESQNKKIPRFETMTEEWLDFIANCRTGHPHIYDIVEGQMANDTISLHRHFPLRTD